MTRAIGHMPDGLTEIQRKQRQLAICDNGLVQQAIIYRSWEQKLLAAYRRYLSTHEVEMVVLMDKMESKLSDAYEDIARLLVERQALRSRWEVLHDAYQTKAMDLCDSLLNSQPIERLDRVWIDKTRHRLICQMQEKNEAECRLRAWDLNDFQRQLKKAALAAFARHDADAEANKEYVNQYTVNLIGYAVRIGQFPEDIVKTMNEHQQSENELTVKLADNFEAMEKERLDQERTMYSCAMAGQNISKWVNEHVRRAEQRCFEREKLYYDIREKRKQVVTMRQAAETMLNSLYGGRAAFIEKQLKELEDVVLRAKRERELMHARTIVVLKKPDFRKRANKN